jgi:hypothetical protein
MTNDDDDDDDVDDDDDDDDDEDEDEDEDDVPNCSTLTLGTWTFKHTIGMKKNHFQAVGIDLIKRLKAHLGCACWKPTVLNRLLPGTVLFIDGVHGCLHSKDM